MTLTFTSNLNDSDYFSGFTNVCTYCIGEGKREGKPAAGVSYLDMML